VRYLQQTDPSLLNLSGKAISKEKMATGVSA
jgi:hypothetical protein